jgi:hypothetical protein
LIAVNGYYDVVSMTLNVARVAPPAGEELPFKQAGPIIARFHNCRRGSHAARLRVESRRS